MPRKVLETWMTSIGNLLVFQARRFAFGAWAILIIFTAIGFQRQSTLSEENRKLIVQIQHSRLEACQATFQSFHVVFDPFFPPPEKRTLRQIEDFEKFNTIIAKRIDKCQVLVNSPTVTTK